MKKSAIVILIGGFILLTAFLGPISHEKMYKKQKSFESTEEIIQVLNTYPILEKDVSKGRMKETDEFEECLSVRKRLTNTTDLNYVKLDVEEVVELDEKTKTDLLNYYTSLRERYSKRLPISKQEAVRLKIKTYYLSNHMTGEIEMNDYDEFLDLVLIDEGEGFVIDFENMFNVDYIPDYSKIDKDDGIYYKGQNQYDESIIQEDVEKTENAIYEEVEANA